MREFQVFQSEEREYGGGAFKNCFQVSLWRKIELNSEVFIMLLFSVPKQYMSQTEHPDIHEYSNIYNYNCREKGCHRKKRMPRELRDCTSEYPDCEFSLLEMILGRYAVEPTKHGPAVPFMWINDIVFTVCGSKLLLSNKDCVVVQNISKRRRGWFGIW